MDSKSKEYWNSRIQDVYDEIYDRKTIRKIYRKAYYDVEADIKSLYDSLKDTGDISTTKLYQFERFISLKKELKNQAKYVKSTLDNEVTKTLTQAYKDTFDTVSHMVGKDRTWGIQNDKMVEAAVHKKWQGANFSERIWKDTDELARDVKAAITDCITRGVSKDVYVKQIMKQYNAGFSKADRLVRTELMHTINTAQIETYKMDGVTKVEWYTADDERVCSDCGSMHGRIFDIKEVGNDVEVIAHPNCRCTYLPVVDDIESIEFQTDTVDNSGKSGIIKIHQGKQDKHIRGTNNYVEGKSYLTVSNEEIERIIKSKSGTGKKIGNKEQIVADKIIGVNVNTKRGFKTLTDTAHIHSSKDGQHLVPTHTQLRTKSIPELNLYAKKMAMEYYDMPECTKWFGKMTSKEKEQRIELLLSQKTSKTALIKDIKSMERKILKYRGDIK